MTAQLRPELIERYEKLHASAEPVVLQRLRASNLKNYRIVRSELMLTAMFEHSGSDLDGDLRAFRSEPGLAEWMRVTDACLVPRADDPNRRWSLARTIFFAP